MDEKDKAIAAVVDAALTGKVIYMTSAIDLYPSQKHAIVEITQTQTQFFVRLREGDVWFMELSADMALQRIEEDFVSWRETIVP